MWSDSIIGFSESIYGHDGRARKALALRAIQSLYSAKCRLIAPVGHSRTSHIDFSLGLRSKKSIRRGEDGQRRAVFCNRDRGAAVLLKLK
jgi:hypothetical protein